MFFLDIPKYLDMFDYIKGNGQQFTVKPKKSLHIIFKVS